MLKTSANASAAHTTAPITVKTTLMAGPVRRNPVEPLPSVSAAAGGPVPLGASSTRHGGVVVGSTAHSAAGGPWHTAGTPRRLATLGGTSRRGETSCPTLRTSA